MIRIFARRLVPLIVILIGSYGGANSRPLLAQQSNAVEDVPLELRAETDARSEWSNESVLVYLDAHTLRLEPTKQGLQDKRFTIPRLCASIRSINWGSLTEGTPKFVPETDHWVFSWQDSVAERPVIQVVFDQRPVLLSDCPRAEAAGDGSVMLHASEASTFGEKLRFEPQWYKNTVGYWTIPKDYATWSLNIEQPGQYSIAVLQGCGEGQGGSDALLTLHADTEVAAELPFRTIDTGHFQNFRWNHLGLINVAAAGEYQLRIQPVRIAKAALFDVRAIHLVPQAKPDGG